MHHDDVTTDIRATATLAHDVMKGFAELRGEILDVVGQAEALCTDAGRAGQQARGHLEFARGAVSEARLNLVVVGGEGQGKSTLINALLGAELTPVSDLEPGTVAPVFIQHGPSLAPEYEVQIEGDLVPLRTKDRSEFDRYLLQAMNENNRERVVAGTVRVAHQLLSSGLRIVDMPGTEGASATIADVAQAFIRRDAHAVIGVLRRAGGYGPFSRICATMMPPNRDPEAIVFNSDLESWMARSLESEQHALLAQLRPAALRRLRDGSPRLGLPEDHIFVLHLPTFHAQRLGGADRQLQSAVHAAEIDRFESFVWAYMRDNGVSQMIREAHQSAESALRELQAWLSWRIQALDTVEKGGDEYEKLGDDLEVALQAGRKEWRRRAGEEVVEALVAEAWAPVNDALVSYRGEVQEAILQIKSRLQREEGALSRSDAGTLRSTLDDAVGAASRRLAECQRSALDRFAKTFIDYANESLALVNERVPLLQDTVGRVVITTDEVVRVKLGSGNRGLIEQFGHLAAVAGPGFGLAAACGALPWFGLGAASNVALLLPLMNPITGWFVGLAAGAAAGHALYSRLRDPERVGLTKVLDRLQRDVAKVNGDDEGEECKRWVLMARAVVEAVGAALEARLAGIAQVFVAPEENRGRLASERSQVQSLIAQVGAMDGALLAIVQRIPRRAAG